MFARISSLFVATLAAVLLCALPTPAYSAGLGKLTVRSALGQRLNAEIEILSLQPGEFDSLKVQLASPDAFRQAGIEINPVLSSVRMQIERREAAAVVRLVSTQPISDPFLDLLVEMQWSAGRLVREYTFLLDPPGYAGRNVIAAVPADRPVAAGQTPGPRDAGAAPDSGAAPGSAAGVPAASAESGGEIVAIESPMEGAEVSPQEGDAAPALLDAEKASSSVQGEAAIGQRTLEERPLDDEARTGPQVVPQRREPAPPQIREHEVARGDTLGVIARSNLHSGVSLNQMMIALYRENPEAFLRRNINLVRAGRILTIPDRDAVASIDPREAQRLVLSHRAEFDQYRRVVAERALRAAPLAESGGRTSAGRIEQQAEAPPPSAARDEVRLSKLDPAKPSAAAARAAREDEIAAREREVKEARSRVSDLEKNVADLRKLLELKNQQLAELEKKATSRVAEPQKPAVPVPPQPAGQSPESKPAAPVPKPQPPAAATPLVPAQREPIATPPTVVAKAPEPQKPAPPVQHPSPSSSLPQPEAAPAVAPAPIQKAQSPQPSVAAGKVAPRAPEPAPQSFIDEFTESPYALPGAGLVVLVVGAYGFIMWRRRRASVGQFQDSIISSQSKMSSSSVFAAGGQQGGGPSSVVLPSVSRGSASRVEADEVDPVAEADVYMAYGRDAQAEEILNEAIAKDPNRASYHAKLLEIYSNRRDTNAFEQGVRKLKEITGGTGLEWDKATSLGRALDPANALYGGAGHVDGAGDTHNMAELAPALDVDLNAAAGAAAAPDLILGGPSGADESASGASSGLDFDLGGGSDAAPAGSAADFSPGGTLIVDVKDVAQFSSTPSTAESPGAASGGLDFDLGGIGETPKPESGGLDFELPADNGAASSAMTEIGTAAPAGSEGSAGGGLNFDMKFDVGEPAADVASESAVEPPAVDLSAISLDLGSGGASPVDGGGGSDDPKWQEVATKLDLAKAYEEMGDKSGASELLNEVLREGDAAQRSQAEELLAKIG